ncbi:MAG: DUF4236 domain-containing protein [Sphaerospermopsis sp. SIO1G2]|nr:DUF4236 domain-containing protein [Sphaerospermopsis sp. SIO1G2]
MGIYLRKSVSVGSFRFNLSKSGVGLSAGVKGFRVGTGPRGNYVHMGRGGIYYRKTLPSATKQNQPHPKEAMHESMQGPLPKGPTHGPMQEIESGCVTEMVDSNSAELLEEINSKHKKTRYWPFVLCAGLIFSFLSASPVIGLLITGVLALIARYYDQFRKTVVLLYELEPDAEQRYEKLIEAMDCMASCNKLWHIESEGQVYDRKYHGGASGIIDRKPTVIGKTAPQFLKTNIVVPVLGVGKQTMHFFPDRVLIYETGKVGAVSYQNLDVQTFISNFIEDKGVPKDSRVVDRTWQYVNKNGGPDRRFANNPEIPVVEYEYVHFRSGSGLNEQICLSKVGASDGLAQAIKQLSNVQASKAA